MSQRPDVVATVLDIRMEYESLKTSPTRPAPSASLRGPSAASPRAGRKRPSPNACKPSWMSSGEECFPYFLANFV